VADGTTTRIHFNSVSANNFVGIEEPHCACAEMMLTNQRHSLFVIQVDFVRRPVMVFCRLNQPAVMADLSEVALPTRFLFLVLTPEDAGPNAIWEISEMGRSLGSMLGDKVILLYKTVSVSVCVCVSVSLFRMHGHSFEPIYTTFGKWNPYTLRMVMCGIASAARAPGCASCAVYIRRCKWIAGSIGEFIIQN